MFVELSDSTGAPDGSTVDAEGGLWNAQWGGARIVRYAPDGRETARIEVPAEQPSCVSFGGVNLDTLYITTAGIGLDRSRDAHVGGVFTAQPGARGIAKTWFAGKL